MSETAMVAELARDVIAMHRTRVPIGSAAGAEAELWDLLEQLGLTLAAVPDRLGGSGAGVETELAILREAGRGGVSLPVLETGLLAGWLLAGAGLQAEPGQFSVAPTGFGDEISARHANGALVLSGTSHHTPFAEPASRLIVCATAADQQRFVSVVPRGALQINSRTNMAGESRGTVVFEEVAVESFAPSDAALGVQLQRRGVIGRCVMICGALASVRDMTAGYVTKREQFGRPLRKFQAVEHQLAVLARECVLAEAATDVAVASLARNREISLPEAAAAKVVCGRAAANVLAIAHQLHGAIGVTREYPLQSYTRLVLGWREDYGSERGWATALGRQLRQNGLLWEQIASTGSLREPALGVADA